MSGDNASMEPSEMTASGVIDRRGFLQLGGFAVAVTAPRAVGTRPAAAGTLRIGVPNYPASWDQDYGAFDPVALTLYKNVYPYMVDYGVTEIDGAPVLDTTNIVPSIAESWTPDEEGREWTLVLKDGLV